jgi:hypothetical protein
LTTRILTALLIIDLLALGAHPALANPSSTPNTVAVVGHTAITVRDISYRLKTEKAYENLGATEETALISLINDAIEHEVALLNGVVATQEEIEALRKFVEHKGSRSSKSENGLCEDSTSMRSFFVAQDYQPKPSFVVWNYKSERESIEKACCHGKSFQQTADQLDLIQVVRGRHTRRIFNQGQKDLLDFRSTVETPGDL